MRTHGYYIHTAKRVSRTPLYHRNKPRRGCVKIFLHTNNQSFRITSIPIDPNYGACVLETKNRTTPVLVIVNVATTHYNIINYRSSSSSGSACTAGFLASFLGAFLVLTSSSRSSSAFFFLNISSSRSSSAFCLFSLMFHRLQVMVHAFTSCFFFIHMIVN